MMGGSGGISLGAPAPRPKGRSPGSRAKVASCYFREPWLHSPCHFDQLQISPKTRRATTPNQSGLICPLRAEGGEQRSMGGNLKLVGVAGFEPTTPSTPRKCASQAALHADTSYGDTLFCDVWSRTSCNAKQYQKAFVHGLRSE